MTPLAPDAFASARQFARHMLRGDALRLSSEQGAVSMFTPAIMEAILFRSGRWQIELITMLPGASVPPHRHLRVDSADVLLAGMPAGVVIGGRRIPCVRSRGSLAANLVHVAKGVCHSGGSGEAGAVYLSFQMWDGQPGFISEDWEAEP